MRNWKALHEQAKEYGTAQGKALPPLKADSPDALLVAAMTLRWDVVEQAQIEATQAHHTARSRRFSAVGDLDLYWQNAIGETGRLHKEIQIPNSHNENEWDARLEMLRLSLQTRDHFNEYVDVYNMLSDEQRSELQQKSNRAVLARQYQASLLPPKDTNIPQFSVAAFLYDLSRRGIGVSRHGDDIVVRPSASLCEQDRTHLRNHKAAILSSLGTHETF